MFPEQKEKRLSLLTNNVPASLKNTSEEAKLWAQKWPGIIRYVHLYMFGPAESAAIHWSVNWDGELSETLGSFPHKAKRNVQLSGSSAEWMWPALAPV